MARTARPTSDDGHSVARLASVYLGSMTTSSSRAVTLGLVQMRCGLDLEENMRKALDGVREAAGRGAQIVCLQELFRSQYFCREENAELFDLAEPIPGPSTGVLSGLAAE